MVGDSGIHYVPLAWLKKERLLGFDVWDEQGSVLPLVSRDRGSRFAAAALSALAHSLMLARFTRLDVPWRERAQADGLVVPEEIEAAFWNVAFLGYEPGEAYDASSAYESFVARPSSSGGDVTTWKWSQDPDGRWRADADALSWFAKIGGDPQFANFVASFKRNFLVCVPLRYESGRRRIVKYTYSEPLSEPETKAKRQFKRAAAAVAVARAMDRAEDSLEGLPATPQGSRVQWMTPTIGDDEALRSRTKVARGVGWACLPLTIDASGVSDAASYHLEVQLPPGLQARRAHLDVTAADGDPIATPVLRGVRNVERVHMYAKGLAATTGKACLHVRPQSSVIVRGATLCAVVAAVVLTIGAFFGGDITGGNNDQTEAAAAILVLVPAILAGYAARGQEHPMATSMVFGLRLLALMPGLLAVVAAGLIVFDRIDSWAGWLVAALAWVVAFVLGISWRLAIRGRPHPSVPPR
jgi:hypothetical protein